MSGHFRGLFLKSEIKFIRGFKYLSMIKKKNTSMNTKITINTLTYVFYVYLLVFNFMSSLNTLAKYVCVFNFI